MVLTRLTRCSVSRRDDRRWEGDDGGTGQKGEEELPESQTEEEEKEKEEEKSFRCETKDRWTPVTAGRLKAPVAFKDTVAG